METIRIDNEECKVGSPTEEYSHTHSFNVCEFTDGSLRTTSCSDGVIGHLLFLEDGTDIFVPLNKQPCNH